MTWLLENWSEIAAAASTVWGAYQTRKHRQAKKRAAALAKQLDAIRIEAGTKGPWEVPLGEQTRSARNRARK